MLKNEIREVAEAISKVKRHSEKPDYERVFILGVIRGMEVKEDIEMLAGGSCSTYRPAGV